MRRVARPGGVVSGCVWDFESGMPLLRAAWDAALAIDAELARSLGADRRLPFSRPDELTSSGVQPTSRRWKSARSPPARTTRI